jgi:hypothetical protein
MKFCLPQIFRWLSTAALTLGTLVFLAIFTAPALAGGGPENVFLIVNSADIGSKTIANYYIQLRNIPPDNVLYLDPKSWNGSSARIDINLFREKILEPILEEIKKRMLDAQVDSIIYSS